MCGGVKYQIDGVERIAHAGVEGTLLPIVRAGRLVWIGWGQPRTAHYSSPATPGYFLKFPEGYWLELEAIRAGKLWQFKPEAVKLSVRAFYVYTADVDGERWIELRPGEYLQGAALTVFAERRVYVVAVQPPAEYADARPAWPRIVQARQR
jgi:hypothetical protein